MSMFSRRDFMKGAGAMALAVAAAGMLGGCSESTKKAVMEDVKVEYWYKGFISETHIENGEFDETVSVVKGQEKIKKELLKNLGKACSGSTTYDIKKVPDEISIDRDDPAKPIAKVYLEF